MIKGCTCGALRTNQTWPSLPTFKGRAIFLLLSCFSTIAGPQASGLFSCLVFLACGLRTQVLRLEQQAFYCCKEDAYFLIQGKAEHICLVLKKLREQSGKPDSHTGASWRSCPRKKCTSLSRENALEAQHECAEGQLYKIINATFFLTADYWKGTTSAQKGVGK